MDITFFHWAYGEDSSIKRSFAPLISELKKTNTIKEFSVPYKGANPINVLRNILFVYKHRNKKGINHVTGDIHYCILGLIGVKSVLTIHDDYAYTQAHRGILDKFYKWFLWLYLPIKIADKVLCISPNTKQAIDRLVHNKKTIVLTHNCINNKYKQYPLQNNPQPIALQIGTLPQKNLETTLKAIAGLNIQLHVIRLMTPEQRKLAESLNIKFTNLYDLSDDKVINEYINADIVLFPSLKEGFGMPIIEAQAIGRPVITSNMQPMKWVAGDNYPLLIDPLSPQSIKDTIIKLLESKELYHSVIKKGIENSKRFTIATTYNNFISLYTKLISNE